MTQHYTRNTVEVSAWCRKCSKYTPHRVLDGKLGYCLPCFKRSEELSAAAKKSAEEKERQGRLW